MTTNTKRTDLNLDFLNNNVSEKNKSTFLKLNEFFPQVDTADLFNLCIKHNWDENLVTEEIFGRNQEEAAWTTSQSRRKRKKPEEPERKSVHHRDRKTGRRGDRKAGRDKKYAGRGSRRDRRRKKKNKDKKKAPEPSSATVTISTVSKAPAARRGISWAEKAKSSPPITAVRKPVAQPPQLRHNPVPKPTNHETASNFSQEQSTMLVEEDAILEPETTVTTTTTTTGPPGLGGWTAISAEDPTNPSVDNEENSYAETDSYTYNEQPFNNNINNNAMYNEQTNNSQLYATEMDSNYNSAEEVQSEFNQYSRPVIKEDFNETPAAAEYHRHAETTEYHQPMAQAPVHHSVHVADRSRPVSDRSVSNPIQTFAPHHYNSGGVSMPEDVNFGQDTTSAPPPMTTTTTTSATTNPPTTTTTTTQPTPTTDLTTSSQPPPPSRTDPPFQPPATLDPVVRSNETFDMHMPANTVTLPEKIDRLNAETIYQFGVDVPEEERKIKSETPPLHSHTRSQHIQEIGINATELHSRHRPQVEDRIQRFEPPTEKRRPPYREQPVPIIQEHHTAYTNEEQYVQPYIEHNPGYNEQPITEPQVFMHNHVIDKKLESERIMYTEEQHLNPYQHNAQQPIYTQPYAPHTQPYKPQKQINPYETERLAYPGYQAEEKHDFNNSDYSPTAENSMTNHHMHNSSTLPHQPIIQPQPRQEPHFKQHYAAPTTYNTNMAHTPTATIPTAYTAASHYMPQQTTPAVQTYPAYHQTWHNPIAPGGSHISYSNRAHTTVAPTHYNHSAAPMVYQTPSTNYGKYQVPTNTAPVMAPNVYNNEHLQRGYR